LLASRVDLRLLLMIGLACFGPSMWLFTPIMNQWGFKEMLLPFAFRLSRHRRTLRDCVDGHVDDG
jgi:MFS transporter, DHA2 family, multidrug resistance protein